MFIYFIYLRVLWTKNCDPLVIIHHIFPIFFTKCQDVRFRPANNPRRLQSCYPEICPYTCCSCIMYPPILLCDDILWCNFNSKITTRRGEV